MRAWLLCLAACGSAAPPTANCPDPPAPVVAPAVARPPDNTPERAARACGIAAILLDDAAKNDQLLAHDMVREGEIATKVEDAKRVRLAMDDLMAKIVGTKPAFWAIVDYPSKLVASSQPVSKDQIAELANGFTEHMRTVWVVDNTPLLVSSIPFKFPRGRAMLVVGRALNGTLGHLDTAANATVTMIGSAWSLTSSRRAAPPLDHARIKAIAANGCQPGEMAAQAIAGSKDAFLVVTDAR